MFVKGWPVKPTENEQQLIFFSGFDRDKHYQKLDQQMIVVVLIFDIWREIQNA